MKKISLLFILLFSMFPKTYATKTSHLSEQDLKKIYSQDPSLKKELDQQDPIFALACLGKTELQHYDINKLLRTNPASKRTILHYLAMFNHHQLLKSLLQKYHSLKQKINTLDSYGFAPLHYAMKNLSIECTQLLLHYSEHLTNQDEYDSIPVFDESLENCEFPEVKTLCGHTSPQCGSNTDEFFDDWETNLENSINNHITDYLNDPNLQKEAAPFLDDLCLSNETENKMYNYHVSDNQWSNVKNHPFIEMPHPKSGETVKKGKKRGSKYDQFYNPATQTYECPECEKTYKHRKDLANHMNNQHKSEIVKKRNSKYKQFYNPLSQKYVCPDCGNHYLESFILGQHMKNQHNNEIVKERKKRGSKYNRFYNSLTKEYECPDCGQKYTYYNSLSRHMKNQHDSGIVQKHSNKYAPFYNPLTKEYECLYNDCNKSYKLGSELGQHMKNQHNSEIVKEGKKRGSKYSQFYNPTIQEYECPYNDCNKSYKESYHLGQHMKNQHNSEILQEGKKRGSKYDQFYNSLSKEYVCPDCEKTYKQRNNLGRHMKNQHKSKIVQKRKNRSSKYKQFYNSQIQKMESLKS